MRIGQVATTAMKIAKGLTRAKTECPACGAWLHAVLAGRRNHIHMGCENKECHMRLME